MNTSRNKLQIGLALAVFTLVGCFDGQSVAGPSLDELPTQVSYAKGGKNATRDLTTADAPGTTTETTTTTDGVITLLDRRAPLAESITASAVVTPKGGIVKIPGQVEVRVPRGALTEDVEITVVALEGSKVAFEILPHGITFEKPVSIWFTKSVLSSATDLFGVYYEGDPTAPVVHEVFKTFENKRWIELQTTHFSGYALASGSRGRFSRDEEF